MVKDMSLNDKDTLSSLRKGVEYMADVVGQTLGPRGKNVVYEKGGSICISSDGYYIAREVEHSEPAVNYGVKLALSASSKSNETVGDGTTSVIVLTNSLVKNGVLMVEAGGNPMLIRNGLISASEKAVAYVKKVARAINTNEEIKRVASISSNSESTGALIAKAFDKVGPNGIIKAEKGKSATTEIEVVKGLKIDKGYISHYMVTDQEKMEAHLENPYILITDKKISNIQEMVPLLEAVVQKNRSLFIIAEDVEGNALTNIVVNNVRGIIKVVAVKAPSFGDQKKMILKDIAVLTGTEVISDDSGIELNGISINDLGTAENIHIYKDKSIIVGGNGSNDCINERLSQIKYAKSTTESEYEKSKFEERLAGLSGGICVIKVGGYTEVSTTEQMERIEDSINSTQSALKEGVVKGGGVVYIDILKELKNFALDNEEENMGVRVFKKSLTEILRRIAENAGVDGGVVVDKVLNSELGFDASTKEYVDMFEKGIIDSAIVVMSTITNAVATAGSILTSGSLLYEEKKENSVTTAAPQMY